MKELELKVQEFDNGEIWSLSKGAKSILLSDEEKQKIGCLAGEKLSMDNMGIYGVIQAKMEMIWAEHFPKELPLPELYFGDKVKNKKGDDGIVIFAGRMPYTDYKSVEVPYSSLDRVIYKESELNQLTIIK